MHADRSTNIAPVIWKGQVLVRSVADYEPFELEANGALAAAAQVIPIVIGHDERVVAFLLESDAETLALASIRAVAPDAAFADVMIELGRYDGAMRGALLRAVALERWSNRYRFCPACGFALHWTTDAIAKICTNPARVHRHFPRLDPAIIVLVSDGDRVLLGRAARWPPGWFSTLAGFVEPGETFEAAVRREVREEAGIDVGTTRYFGSESWPFPRSLMVGFFAEAHSTTIALNDAELEEARWFDVRELRELQAHLKQSRPFFDTIARRLIDTWLTEHARD